MLQHGTKTTIYKTTTHVFLNWVRPYGVPPSHENTININNYKGNTYNNNW